MWESQPADEGKRYHVGVFDLNRWYHAQMPRNIRWERATAASSMMSEQQAPKVCSFLAFHSLGTAVEEAGEPLMVCSYREYDLDYEKAVSTCAHINYPQWYCSSIEI